MSSQLYDQVQNIEQRVGELETQANTFPLEQQPSDAIWTSFSGVKWYYGSVTLSAGTATVKTPQTTAKSIGFITTNGTPHVDASGKPAVYGVTCSNGQFTVNGTQSDDFSTVNYLIIVDPTQ